MKVKDLLESINKGIESNGNDFLEFDIYTEQISLKDKQYKRKEGLGNFKDHDDWEYFKVYGFHTTDKENKIWTINVNY